MVDEPSMPIIDLPVESPQKEMEPLTLTLGVTDSVEEMEISATILEAITFEARDLVQEKWWPL